MTKPQDTQAMRLKKKAQLELLGRIQVASLINGVWNSLAARPLYLTPGMLCWQCKQPEAGIS